jgi:hypothetical protein
MGRFILLWKTSGRERAVGLERAMGSVPGNPTIAQNARVGHPRLIGRGPDFNDLGVHSIEGGPFKPVLPSAEGPSPRAGPKRLASARLWTWSTQPKIRIEWTTRPSARELRILTSRERAFPGIATFTSYGLFLTVFRKNYPTMVMPSTSAARVSDRTLCVSFASRRAHASSNVQRMDRHINTEMLNPTVLSGINPKPALSIANAVPSSNFSLKTSARAYLLPIGSDLKAVWRYFRQLLECSSLVLASAQRSS